MNNPPNLKKAAISVAAGVLLISVLIWAWHYLHSGRVIISTNNPYLTISLREINTGNKKPQTFSAHKHLSVNVRLGQYSAEVSGGSQATFQTVILNSHKTLHYTIDPIQLVGVEPVVDKTAQDMSADSTGLVYINDSEKLEKVDSQNNSSLVGQPAQFQNVRWANPSYGVGQTTDQHLDIIDNGSISSLSVPFSYDGKLVGFDVTPEKDIYISHGPDVYARLGEGGFKKIYTARDDELALAGSHDQVAVTEVISDFEPGNASARSEIAVVLSSGKIYKTATGKLSSGDTKAFKWSPDGQFLVVSTGSGSYIYNSSLKKVSTIPANPEAVSWQDSNILYYAYNSSLWRYNVAQQKAELLANMPFGDLITDAAMSDDKSYVYIATLGSGISDTNAIRRVGLIGQKVDSSIFQLQSILPKNLADCSIRLINFSGTTPPTILVIPFKESGLNPQAYINEAQDELGHDGFDPSKLQIKLSQ